MRNAHGVKPGQKVITSSHGSIFPYGVAVGETYVDDNGNIAVRPFADPNRANYYRLLIMAVLRGLSLVQRHQMPASFNN